MIEPAGVHPHAKTKNLLIVDETAISSMVSRFKGDAAAPGFSGC